MEVKVIIRKLIREQIEKIFENMSEYDFDELGSIYMPEEMFGMIKSQTPIVFSVIPKNQYHNALKEFMKFGRFMRFPAKYVLEWKDLMLNNVAKLSALTAIQGHANSFPWDEFYDTFGNEFSKWIKKKKLESKDYRDFGTAYTFLDEVYNIDNIIPKFASGHHIMSDYGLKPLVSLGRELARQNDPNEAIITINRMLEVVHPRGDLAELFIEGGSESLTDITYEPNLV